MGRGILNVASMADWSRSRLDRGARHRGGKEQSPRAKGFPSLAKERMQQCEANRVPGATFGIRAKAWLGACCVLTAMCSVTLAADRRPRSKTLVPRDFFEGKELFEKSWEPGKPSPTGGDGLGPLYNETSCVGCHNQGGTGGGGANDRNVVMLTAVAGSAQSLKGAKLFQGEMEDLHPGFRNRASIVLHRHATTPEIAERLTKLGTFTVVQTREEIKVLEKGEPEHPGPLRRRAHRCDPRHRSCARLRSARSPGSPKSKGG